MSHNRLFIRPGAVAAGVRLAAAVGVALTISGVLHGRAEAALSACRSDPVVIVNGATADIVSTLWTDASAVRELDYTITVPVGSLIGKTTLTVGLGFPEKVTYVYSWAQPWGTMRVDASVVTQAGVSPFATSVQVSTLAGIHTSGGYSNAIVSVLANNLIML